MKLLLTFALLLSGLFANAQNNSDFDDFMLPRVINNTQIGEYVPPLYACTPEPFAKVGGVMLCEWSESKSFYFFETKMTVDSAGVSTEKLPYITLNKYIMRETDTQKNCIIYIYNRKNKKSCYAIATAEDTYKKTAEGSIYLANQLGINANPRTGGQDAEIVYIVFPFSGNGAARSLKEINEIGAKLMQKADGFTFIKDCLENFLKKK